MFVTVSGGVSSGGQAALPNLGTDLLYAVGPVHISIHL